MLNDLAKAYQSTPDVVSLQLGDIILDGQLAPNAPVNLVLKSLNRHGLITGSTGSGKTKTMQVLCEQLSQAGVPTLVMDIKGDISGLAMPGEPTEAILHRSQTMNLFYTPRQFSVELLTLDESIAGVPLRSSIADFGALLLSRMLDLNDTQAGVITILFEYAKDNHMPLIDLSDFKQLLQFMQSEEGKADIEQRYGNIAGSSIGSIMRKIIELESQGGQYFFGEPAFKVSDFIRVDNQGQGVISVLRLMDKQDKPQLFSTFMLKLLSDIYREFPEVGDPNKPKLVLFIDEAHLIFNHASKALLNTIDTIVKLIRSKGVGLVFCTQTPNDIPEAVLGQLGLKIQHALRAFTAKDRKAIKLVAQNFPPTDDYPIEDLLTSLSIGNALVTALDKNGQPTPLVQCQIRTPESRMGVLTDGEVNTLLNNSALYACYRQRKDSFSAADILMDRKKQQSSEPMQKEQQRTASSEQSIITILSKNTLVRQLVRDFFRGLLKLILGKK